MCPWDGHRPQHTCEWLCACPPRASAPKQPPVLQAASLGRKCKKVSPGWQEGGLIGCMASIPLNGTVPQRDLCNSGLNSPRHLTSAQARASLRQHCGSHDSMRPGRNPSWDLCSGCGGAWLRWCPLHVLHDSRQALRVRWGGFLREASQVCPAASISPVPHARLASTGMSDAAGTASAVPP